MKREIEFRGKRVDNGEWVEGYYFKAKLHWHRFGVHEDWIATSALQNGGWCNVVGKHAVIPETVGQYTGITDKNGKKVYVGDILHIRCGHGIDCVIGKAIVYFSETLLQFRVKAIQPYAYDSEVGDLYKDCDFAHIDEYEVIGNIFDKESDNGD